MGSPFSDPLAVDDDDLIGVPDVESRWAMVMVVRFLESSSRLFWMWRSLSLSRAAGGLIQDQDRRIFKEYPGNGDPLLLAAGKPCTPLDHKGVVAVGKLHDEVVDAGLFWRRQ